MEIPWKRCWQDCAVGGDTVGASWTGESWTGESWTGLLDWGLLDGRLLNESTLVMLDGRESAGWETAE